MKVMLLVTSQGCRNKNVSNRLALARAVFFCVSIFRMKLHFWHTFLLFFFVALALVAFSWLAGHNRLTAWIPLGDFVLISLAIFRLIRLFTYDAITAFLREWFVGADPESFRGSLGTLINCPWCTGLWFSLVVVFFYFLTPFAWYGILILALGAVASFLQLLANLIGWSAEAKKREAHAIALPRDEHDKDFMKCG